MSSAAAELLKHFHHHRETVAPLRAALVQLSCGSSSIHSSRHPRWGGFAGLSRLPLSSLIDQQPARLPALRPALLRANNATRSNVAVAAPASAVSVLPTPSHLRATGRIAQRNTRHIASFGGPERHNNRRIRSGKSRSRGAWFPIQTRRVLSGRCQSGDRRLSHRIRLAPRLSEDIASTVPTLGEHR
jgi:hypothetical protein